MAELFHRNLIEKAITVVQPRGPPTMRARPKRGRARGNFRSPFGLPALAPRNPSHKKNVFIER